MDYHKHIILENEPLNKALIMLDELAVDAILFTINDLGKLTGSLTDGDVRRGLMNGAKIDSSVDLVSFKTPKHLEENQIELTQLIALREGDFNIIPIINMHPKREDIVALCKLMQKCVSWRTTRTALRGEELNNNKSSLLGPSRCCKARKHEYDKCYYAPHGLLLHAFANHDIAQRGSHSPIKVSRDLGGFCFKPAQNSLVDGHEFNLKCQIFACQRMIGI